MPRGTPTVLGYRCPATGWTKAMLGSAGMPSPTPKGALRAVAFSPAALTQNEVCSPSTHSSFQSKKAAATWCQRSMKRRFLKPRTAGLCTPWDGFIHTPRRLAFCHPLTSTLSVAIRCIPRLVSHVPVVFSAVLWQIGSVQAAMCSHRCR